MSTAGHINQALSPQLSDTRRKQFEQILPKEPWKEKKNVDRKKKKIVTWSLGLNCLPRDGCALFHLFSSYQLIIRT